MPFARSFASMSSPASWPSSHSPACMRSCQFSCLALTRSSAAETLCELEPVAAKFRDTDSVARCSSCTVRTLSSSRLFFWMVRSRALIIAWILLISASSAACSEPLSFRSLSSSAMRSATSVAKASSPALSAATAFCS